MAAAIALLVKYWKRSDSKSVPLEFPAPAKRNQASLDRAYFCFAFLGLVTLPIGVGALLSVLHWVNFDEGSTAGGEAMYFGMLLGAPLSVGILGASIYGIWQTVRFRHRALIVLSVITIACAGGLIVLMPHDGPDLPIVDYGMGFAFAIYITANLLVPAWWFAKGRRRYRSGALGFEWPLRSSPPGDENAW